MPFTGCFESSVVVKEMALVKQIESPSGITLEQGYHKIAEGHLKWIENKRRWYLKYTVEHYYDRTARKQKKEPVFMSEYLMKINLTDEADGNPIAQAYEHLKTMEGFEEGFEEAGDIGDGFFRNVEDSR